MEDIRHTCTFNIRYAVRVLERHARMWRKIDYATRMMSLLSGSGVIWALGAENKAFALGTGIAFAVLQAIEFAFRPGEIAERSIQQKKLYAALYAKSEKLDNDKLQSEYRSIGASDEITISDQVKNIAYNDVVKELSSDDEYFDRYKIKLNLWGRVVSLLV